MTADELRAFTLLTVMLTTHFGLFTLTNLWFRKGLNEQTSKEFSVRLSLFVIGNLWPITWTAYLIYVSCDKISSVMRHRRVQKLVHECNRLEKEVADKEGELERLKDSRAELEEIIVRQTAEIRELEASDNSPTSLPPYTPDVWKAIRELERRLNGTESYIKHRDRMNSCTKAGKEVTYYILRRRNWSC